VDHYEHERVERLVKIELQAVEVTAEHQIALPAKTLHERRSRTGLRAKEANVLICHEPEHGTVTIHGEIGYPVGRAGKESPERGELPVNADANGDER